VRNGCIQCCRRRTNSVQVRIASFVSNAWNACRLVRIPRRGNWFGTVRRSNVRFNARMPRSPHQRASNSASALFSSLNRRSRCCPPTVHVEQPGDVPGSGALSVNKVPGTASTQNGNRVEDRCGVNPVSVPVLRRAHMAYTQRCALAPACGVCVRQR